MTLIECPVCEEELSSQAHTCCHCGHPLKEQSSSSSNNDNAWNAATRAKTPINVFALAMMTCASILGVFATQIGEGNEEALTAFTYTLHIFLAVCGMFFATILFCRKGIYHPMEVAKARQAGGEDLGQDRPMVAALLILFMVLGYGIYHFLDSFYA
jgi:hypothetical protein